MKAAAWMPALLIALAPLVANAADPAEPANGTRVSATSNASAKDADSKDKGKKDDATARAEAGQAKQACEQQEQDKGHGDGTSKVVCAVKVAFQNRIRRKKDDEPVEMTVGSPPMKTDDTDTPGSKTWEVNFVADGSFAGGEHEIEAPLLDINYGIGEKLQLKYEVPYVISREAETAPVGGTTLQSAHGVGDSILGIKYRFYDNDETGLSFAIYPQVSFRTPGANRSVSEGHTELILPMLMTKEFEHASISANIGVEAMSDQHRWFASFGMGRRLTDHVAFLTEVAGTDLNAVDERRILLNVGLRRKISEKQSVMGSVGRDLYSGGGQQGQSYFSIAFQQLFGG